MNQDSPFQKEVLAKHLPPGEQINFMDEVAERLRSHPVEDYSNRALFIGSSIFQQWTTLAQDMHPVPVVNQAFGGSRTWDVLYFMEQLVIPYQPRSVFFYCGSNDFVFVDDPEGIANRFRAFVDRLHESLPGTPVFYVSINRVPEKQAKWDLVDEANLRTAAWAHQHPLVTYIDMTPAFFNPDATPRTELFVEDMLHFKPESYSEFRNVIRPFLMGISKS